MHAYVSVCVVLFVSFFPRLIILQFKIGLLWSMSSVFRFRWKACCFVLFMIKSQVYLLYGLHIKVTIDYSKNTFFFFALCFLRSANSELRLSIEKWGRGVNIGLAKRKYEKKTISKLNYPCKTLWRILD